MNERSHSLVERCWPLRCVWIVVLLFAFTFEPTCRAAASDSPQEKPVIRWNTDATADSTTVVGQRVRLILDVFGKEGWANVPDLPDLNIPGTIVYLPTGQSVRLNETIRGESWTGQRNEWWLYPQRPGTIEIPALQVSIQIKTYDPKSTPIVSVQETEPLSFAVVLPDGVELQSGLVASTSFSAKQTWQPAAPSEKDQPWKVGDGITRKVVRTTEGAPALTIPELVFADVPGTSLYPKDAETQESNQRGNLKSDRTDQATYVFVRPGVVELPALNLRWWNIETQSIETVTLEGQTIEVVEASPAPLASADSVDGSGRFPSKTRQSAWVLLGCLVIVSGCALMWRRHGRVANSDSESNHFHEFIRVSKSEETDRILRALFHWSASILETSGVSTLESFYRIHADGQTQPLQELYLAMDRGSKRFDASQLAELSHQARDHWLRSTSQHRVRDSVLPALNG